MICTVLENQYPRRYPTAVRVLFIQRSTSISTLGSNAFSKQHTVYIGRPSSGISRGDADNDVSKRNLRVNILNTS